MSKVVVVAVVAALSGCGFDNNNASGTDAGSDAGSDDGPCTLPDMTSDGVSTLAGCSEAGTSDGKRGIARFNNPVNVAISTSGTGNSYVVDYDSSLLRMVDSSGNVTTIFKDPQFNRPFGIIMLSDGNLIVECDADVNGDQNSMSGTVWKIQPQAPAKGTIIATNLLRPRGLVELSANQLAYTDYEAFTVNLLDMSSGTSTVLAGSPGADGHVDGNGAAATFSQPWDLVKDNDGNLIVTDFESHVIRKVTLTGDVTTIGGAAGQAGHVDGPLASARFNSPKGLTRDTAGNIYISEAGNHDIRKIDTTGMVSTIAGGTGGYGDSEDPMAAAFYGIEGLDVTPDGKRLVIADGNDGDSSPFNHVRVLQFP